MNRKSRKLADIDQEIRALVHAAITGQIPHSLARHEIQVLKDDRERVWGW